MSRSFLTEGLPAPLLVDMPSHSEAKALRLEDIVGAMREGGTPYDVEMLETDPIVIAAERNAWGDDHFVALATAKARAAVLVRFAFGPDLDEVAGEEGMVRLPGEEDEALQERIILKRKGISVAGPDDYFIRLARDADVRVRDVAISASTEDDAVRVLHLAILSNEPGGVASDELLAKVTAIVDDPKVRPRFVRAEAVRATITPQNVRARIWLYPSTTDAQVSQAILEARLREAFAAEQRLGWDLTRSWIVSKLHVSGIQRVEISIPTANLYTAFNEAPALGTIEILNEGRVL